MSRFKAGDVVVYVRQKSSTSPGPRAREVRAAPTGENYSYLVDKFWIVRDVSDNGDLVLLTRTGKEHVIPQDDPHLRRPSIWQRIFMRHKFPRRDQVS